MSAHASLRRQLPSVRALWAILWQAVVLMPVMLVWMAVWIALPVLAPFLLLCAVLYAFAEMWSEAALHLAAAIPLAIATWFWMRRARRQPSTSELHRDGYVV